MLIVTPPYVAFAPPLYWCRRRPTQNPDGMYELLTVWAPFHSANQMSSGSG